MSRALLGDTLDIHGGGLDLRFPHHENELAQSESGTGQPFARVWMHNGLLKLKDKDGHEAKMAGGVGNVLNVADALKHVSGEVLRFFTLQTHYRSPIDLGVWDWNDPATPIPEGLKAASRAIQAFYRFFERFERISGKSFHSLDIMTHHEMSNGLSEEDTKGITPGPTPQTMGNRFLCEMDEDFNTGGAIGVLFEALGKLNKEADNYGLDTDKESPKWKGLYMTFERHARELRTAGHILGLFDRPPAKAELGGGGELVGGLMQLLIDLRANLRDQAKSAAKDNPLRKGLFDQTDLIRTRLAGRPPLAGGATSWAWPSKTGRPAPPGGRGEKF